MSNSLAPLTSNPGQRAYASDPVLTLLVTLAQEHPADTALHGRIRAALDAGFNAARRVGYAPAFHALRDAVQDVASIQPANES